MSYIHHHRNNEQILIPITVLRGGTGIRGELPYPNRVNWKLGTQRLPYSAMTIPPEPCLHASRTPVVHCRIFPYQNQAAPLRGAGSGAPRAGLWPWGGPARRARAVPAASSR